jgi:tetratricopeptide (TPR) repeat protein/tRNA A-37 threonylcarbamoyl transferase component Bud32
VPIDPKQFQTGGALQGEVAASLLRERDAANELAAGSEIGVYRVLREVARGGMAIVYLAERADGEYRQQVALKWMQAGRAGAAAEALFRRERQALADLRHPHIARLLDGGRTSEGRPWFAMEFIDGVPLDRHCIERALPVVQRLVPFAQICTAVAFAHARGILHRDIKPSNVLVDNDGSAKLLDFGIAQLLGESDAPAVGACTPGFASPEQLRGEPPTVASDVYQLGRLLASILASTTDERATVIAREAERVTRLIDPATPSDEPALAASPAGLPIDLAAILSRATHADPAHRYATVEALSADIDAFLSHRPVAARPATVAYSMQRFAQRHPFGVGATALVAVLVIGMAFAFTTRLRAERDVAEQQRDAAQREREIAEQARAGTEAINRFLNEDLLDAANPLRRPPGAPEVTVRDAIASAETRVEGRFAQQPAIATEILTTLGSLHFEFGDDERAQALYRRAFTAAESLEATHAARLRLRAEQASLLITTQQFDAAIEVLESLLMDTEATVAASDPRRFEWQLRLLEARSRQGADASFVPQLRELRDRIEHALGEPNALAGETSLLAANALVFSGKPDQALSDAERAHRHLSATFGPDHPSTLKALSAIAHGRRAQGNAAEAVAAMREAHRLQVERYGPDAGDSLFLQNELAFTLSALGQLDEAESLFADLVERRSRQITRGVSPYLQALGNLATTHYRQGRLDAALGAYERAARVLASDAEVVPQVRSNLERGRGDVLRELGRFDLAEAAYEESERAAAALPANDVRRLALQGSRARLLLATGRDVDGRALLDEAISALQTNVAPNHPILASLLEARDALPR